LEKYKNKRENRSSPRFVEGAKVGGAESPSPSDDGSPAIDSNVIESAGDAETESEQHNSFIDDSEPLADAAEELEAVLGSQRRTLEEHFAVFIEYIVRVRFEPGFAPSRMFILYCNSSYSFNSRGVLRNGNPRSASKDR
jgi:hypothetical protein